MFVHVYYIDGLLIDTGPKRMQKQLLTATKDLNIEQLFITHFHEDHSGNIRSLQEMHQCKAYASEMTCEVMKAPPKLSFIQQVMYGQREAFEGLTPLGESLVTNNSRFEIIPIPGHAPDMVCLYEPERKWLFSADLYISSYIGYFLCDESVLQQIESIRRIMQLDFDVMFCAHKPQFRGGKAQLAKKLSYFETFFDEVAILYKQGYTAREIYKRMNLKEHWTVRLLSGGKLSKLNMVRSALRDLEKIK